MQELAFAVAEAATGKISQLFKCPQEEDRVCQACKVAVSRAKRKFKERKYDELNRLLSNPRWWRKVQKMG